MKQINRIEPITLEEALADYPKTLFQHPDGKGKDFEKSYEEAVLVKNSKFEDVYTNGRTHDLICWAYDFANWYEWKMKNE